MLAIPNLSVWERAITVHHIPRTQTIRLMLYRDRPVYRLDGLGLDFNTLATAKRSAGYDPSGNKWAHRLRCPRCLSAIQQFNSDFADYSCNSCGAAYTRFGEKGVKHHATA